MKLRVVEIITLVFLFGVTRIGSTNAYFSDQAVSVGNVMTAGTWDSSPTPDVVLNEILPDPLGDDGAVKPNGEWLELYNKSGSTASVAGWYLTDADGHSVLIIGAITNTGGTDIASHGFLVIYTGTSPLTLDNGGDTVNLYSGSVVPGNLVDSHLYGATPEGKSIARIPDGGDTWYDPIPTPGEPNKLESGEPEKADDQGEAKLEEPVQESSGGSDIAPEEANSTAASEAVIEDPVEEVEPEATPEIVIEEPQTEVQESVDQEPATEPELPAQPEPPEVIPTEVIPEEIIEDLIEEVELEAVPEEAVVEESQTEVQESVDPEPATEPEQQTSPEETINE